MAFGEYKNARECISIAGMEKWQWRDHTHLHQGCRLLERHDHLASGNALASGYALDFVAIRQLAPSIPTALKHCERLAGSRTLAIADTVSVFAVYRITCARNDHGAVTDGGKPAEPS
ncbi:hypothetical protein [Devosia sp. Leaf420]|uniref:hypothetical protein n=1 Tax=Devosia sp. Leaf420 TaxID=1736374 RepID=UPI000783F401|nr:hypothetical protein [Devosia sp. Leaf420]